MGIEQLQEFGLEAPPPVFSARTMNRSLSDVYSQVQDYDRDTLIKLIETEHGTLDGIDVDRLGFWRASISNSSLDLYFTRMAKSSLQNYAADASSPTVAFQNSHRHNELPVGRSVVGQFIEAPSDPASPSADYFPATIADFYSHRDLQLGDVSVEQFLLGVQSHVVKDVSIGFKEGEGYKNTCSICGDDYFSWDCRHIAGMEYSVAADGGVSDPTDSDEDRKQLCFVWIENARLSEVSAVYDGATTNAMIIKAEREARAGRLDRDVETYLERRFRYRRDVKTWIKGDRGIFVPEGADDSKGSDGEQPNSDRGENMNNSKKDGNTDTVDTVTPALRSLAIAIGLGATFTAETAERAVIETEMVRVSKINADKAAKYDAFRTAEIEAAIQEKIRAEGDGFDEAAQSKVRSMLEAVDTIETIREFAAEWKTRGDARFQGGRKSEAGDDNEDDKGEETTRNDSPFAHVPKSKFAGGV